MFSGIQAVLLILFVLWLPGFSMLRFFLEDRKQKNRERKNLDKKEYLFPMTAFLGGIFLSIAIFRSARIFLEGRLLVIIHTLAASIALTSCVDLFIEYRYPVDRTSRQRAGKIIGFVLMFVAGLAVFIFGILLRSTPGLKEDILIMKIPFHGKWRVITGGRFAFMNYHNGNPDSQNYAVDFVKQGSIGASRRQKIFAPVSGKVIKAVGHLKEGQWDPPEGNIVIIQTDDNTHVWLCHLQEGSVKVSLGERVEAGDEIAECSASGGSDLPHLHLHAEKEGKPIPMLLGPDRIFPIRGDIVSGEK